MKVVEVPALSPAALKEAVASKNPPFVMDVRDPEEFASFRIPGAVSMPLDEISTRLKKEVAPGRTIVLVDHAGHQTPVAARQLNHLGRTDVKRLDGGILRWQADGLQVSK
jgi:rhodanese-related sulfurtransferase